MSSERVPDFGRLVHELPRIRKVYMRRIGLDAEKIFRARASMRGFVRTGKMLRSIRHRISATGLIVGSKARQAGVLNVGRSTTRTFTIEGRRRKDGSKGPAFERTYKPKRRGDFVTASLGQKALERHEREMFKEIEQSVFGRV